jgi:hypothetical protein
MAEKFCSTKFQGRELFVFVKVYGVDVIESNNAISEVLTEEDARKELGKRRGSSPGTTDAMIEAAKRGVTVSI